jgi:hypothetical protein
MMDFKNTEKCNRKFPKHGYTLNSQNARLLWFPICSFLTEIDKIRIKNKASCKLDTNWRRLTVPFYVTLIKIFISLRDIAKAEILLKNIQSKLDIKINQPVGKKEQKLLIKRAELWEHVSLKLDYVIVLFRRLADHFANVARMMIIDNYGSASTKFKEWLDIDNNKNLRFLCDKNILVDALNNNTKWFKSLRGTYEFAPGKIKKGIRDALEHRPSYLLVHIQNNNFYAHPMSDAQNVPTIQETSNLINFLKDNCNDLCIFFEKICRSVNWRNEYTEQDCISNPKLLIGNDKHITYFWPEI